MNDRWSHINKCKFMFAINNSSNAERKCRSTKLFAYRKYIFTLICDILVFYKKCIPNYKYNTCFIEGENNYVL